MRSQLRMAERDANFFVWVCWVWHAQVHGHVQVVALRSKARFENWFIESRVTRINDDVSFGAGNKRDERFHVTSINRFRREFPRIIKLGHRLFRALPRNVG